MGMRGKELMVQVGKSMVQGGGTFGTFMSIGTGIRCWEGPFLNYFVIMNCNLYVCIVNAVGMKAIYCDTQANSNKIKVLLINPIMFSHVLIILTTS